MGNPKFSKKKYNTPKHPWKENRIETERELIKKYGLKNHKEVWKAKTYLGRYRQQARELLARIGTKNPQVKKESDQLLLHLTKMGILTSGSSLDDVLALETESILSRRLQTLVYLKGFSNTVSHSRQLINHGHIEIDGRKVTIPSYIVNKDEESEIDYTTRSPLNELSHPARPKTDVFEPPVQSEKEVKVKEPTAKTTKEEQKPTEVKKEDKEGEKSAKEVGKVEKVKEEEKAKEENQSKSNESDKKVEKVEDKEDKTQRSNEEKKDEKADKVSQKEKNGKIEGGK